MFTVFVFLAVQCPISNRSIPDLNALAEKYEGRVRFVGVNAERGRTAEEVEKHDREFALKFATQLDPHQELAKRYRALTTPTVVLVSPKGEVLYRGRIDDRVIDFGKQRSKARREDLREALEEALAGKPIAVPETPSVGCSIEGVDR
jgi:thiol-disulfide isomerase/thioredoxin